jgi:hypothetical protein
MHHRFQRHVDEAVREVLDPDEDFVTAVGVAEHVAPTRDDTPVLFGARKIIALTSRRLLLLDYFGVVDRHVEVIAQCRREKARASMTKVFSTRLLHVDFRGAAPTRTYRVYLRFAKRADTLAAALSSDSAVNLFKKKPGDGYREVMSYKLVCSTEDRLVWAAHPANKGWDRNAIVSLLAERAKPDEWDVVYDLADEELDALYASALDALRRRTQEIKRVFGHGPGERSPFGTSIPALLLYEEIEEGEVVADVYPCVEGKAGFCSIRDYLTRTADRSPTPVSG